MLLGLDWDGTVTKDKAFWKAVYYLAKACGHDIIIITMRYEHEPVDSDWPGLVYYTGRKAKKPWCEANGIKIDIYIDDMPEWLLHDSA